MSHFTVLVIGDNIKDQLQPYHEYECTGIKDQYVQFVLEDKAKLMEEWEEEKESYPTFDEFVKEYHGYEFNSNGDVGRWTNPNSKWDWWVVGGRWTGFFKLKAGAQGAVGEPGLMTPRAELGYCDSALKKDIDFECSRNAAAQEAAEKWEQVNSAVKRSDNFKTWQQVLDGPGDIDEKRKEYRSQAEVIAFHSLKDGFFSSVEDYFIPKSVYVMAARNAAGVTFAVVKDGQWYEKGEMGWWGMVSGAKDQEVWNQEYWNLIDGLPEDTLLSVVDCHI